MHRLAAVLLCCAVLFYKRLEAHEIGTTRVSAIFRENGNYEVQIVTDGAALVEKLEALSGRQIAADVKAEVLQSILVAGDEKFRQRIKVAFDGQDLRPDIHYSVAPPINATSASAATIQLTGAIPSGAKQFTWNYAWTFASYALMLRNASSENATTQWLEGAQTSAPFALAGETAPPSRLDTAGRYLTLGFTHILPYGFDHVLFVIGIYLLSNRLRSVLWQVSAFTVAHSITLGLSMYGVLSLSPRIVEPMIAISIAYVAIENIFLSELKSWRIALVFAFGLLHGMGFAGALKELGLPRSEFVTALVMFNVGVEIGQLTVIGAAFLLVGRHWSGRSWYRSRIVVPASAAIACTAIYWTVARLVA